MARKNVHVIRGVVHWAKILGNPVPNYNEDGYEWTMDVTPDKEGLGVLKSLGLDVKLKNKDDDRGDFIQFRQKAHRMDGSNNRPISVTDAAGNPWPNDMLIGNGSVIDVKFEDKEYVVKGKKQVGVYPQAVRVLDHKAYERVEFAPLPKEDKYAKAAEALPVEGKLPEGMEPVKDTLDDDFPE